MIATLAETLRRTVARYEPIAWLAAATALMCACVAAFGHLAHEVLEGETAYDAAVADGLHATATPWLTAVWGSVTVLGDTTTLLAVVVVAAAAMLALRRLGDATLVLLAFAGSSSINLLVKALVARDRPELADPIATAHGYAFPSGHAMTSTVVYGVVAYLVIRALRSTRARLAVVAVAAVLVGLIGFSRLYLGVHFLSDVGAGYLLGTAWLMACLLAANVAVLRRAGAGGQVASTAPVTTSESTRIPSSTR